MKYYILYKTTCLVNNKIYIGIHITNNLNDGYLGSGNLLRKAVKKYGKENFKREILYTFDNTKELVEKEAEIVNEEFIKREDTYNIISGGYGKMPDYIPVVDSYGYKFNAKRDDPRLLTGEIKHINKGWALAINERGEKERVLTDDPRWKTGEIKSYYKDKVNVRFPDGAIKKLDINSEEYKRGGFTFLTDGKVSIKGGLVSREEFSKGNYKGVAAGTVTVKDKKGNYSRVSLDDPRYLSGELKGVNKGYTIVKDRDGRKFRAKSNNIPEDCVPFNTGNICLIHPDTGERKNIQEEYLKEYLDKGFIKGVGPSKVKGFLHIYNKKTKESKMIPPEELEKYKKLGFSEGRNLKGKIIMSNKELGISKFISPEDESYYNDKGWELGRLK